MNIPKQRLAVVTGGSAGIGEEICRQLLADGGAVVSMARRPPSFSHEHLHSIEVDLADRAATAQAADEVARRFAPDTIIHNAGVILPALLPDVKLSDLDTLVEFHLSTAFLLAQAWLRHLPVTSCGCFGSTGSNSIGHEFLQNLVLLALAWLAFRYGGRWSADKAAEKP